MKVISKSYALYKGKVEIKLELPDDVVEGMNKEKLRHILGCIAEKSRNFYLETGNELNSKLS